MTLVVDSSVACKWYLDEELCLTARALADSDELFVAPDLVLAEVGNVAWKRRQRGEITDAQAAEVIAHVPGMFLALLPSQTLLADAFDIARELGHPIYDCFYLAAARRWQVPLVTWDRRLLAKVEGTAWSDRVVSLARYQSGP